METSNSLSNSNTQYSNMYNPVNNADQVLKTSIYSDYGQDWLVEGAEKTFQELGENSLNLKYLEKSLKSKRRLEQRNNESKGQINEETSEVYTYDKNGVIPRKFPFKAEEFKYPNDSSKMTKTVYTKSSIEYGSTKPSNMEIPNKYYPLNNDFSRGFTTTFKNNSLNTAQSNSKVHASLDSVV